MVVVEEGVVTSRCPGMDLGMDHENKDGNLMEEREKANGRYMG